VRHAALTSAQTSPGAQREFSPSSGTETKQRSNLTLSKSTFNAENFTCSLSWSTSSDFGAVHSRNVCGSVKSRKKFTKTPILGSRSFKVVNVRTSGKLVSSALVMISRSMSPTATVLMLDELIAVK